MKNVNVSAYLRYKVILLVIIARQRRSFSLMTCVATYLYVLTTPLLP